MSSQQFFGRIAPAAALPKVRRCSIHHGANILLANGYNGLRLYRNDPPKDLARKMEDFERTQQEHGADIQQLYGCIDQLLEAPPEPPEPPKRRFGFAIPGERELTSSAT